MIEQSGPLDLVVDGQRYRIAIINSPNIDDVIVGEMQAQAYFIYSGTSDPERRVGRDIRDALVRLGVLR